MLGTRLSKTPKVIARLDAAIIALPMLVFGIWGTRGMLRLRNGLVVWSCGGNYEFLKDYIRTFEDARGCRVRYTAAPVQYLLGLAVSGERKPDVIVGRAGPGWLALEQRGALAQGPTFFALDPLGIAVARGNPLGIRTLEDLGRPGVRVAQAPRAMRPKGKVPALLMGTADAAFYPGLSERWEANVTVKATCGRSMLNPLVQGQADAIISPRSLLSYPDVRGKLQFVPVSPNILLAMKKGRGSMPQCAAILRNPRSTVRRELASQFVAGLTSSEALLAQHGYLALDDPRAEDLNSLLHISVPRDMPTLQVALARRLEAYAILREARRRYLKVVYTFGPNHYAARSLYHAGLLSAALGAKAAARADWQRVVEQFPPAGPCEFDSPVLDSVKMAIAVEKQPYEHWIKAARTALRKTDGPPTSAAASPDPCVREFFPVEVEDGDPPKGGKRELGLGLHLLQAGDPEFATRDLLKVVTLKYGSLHVPKAEYLLGVCALQRRLLPQARAQWQRVLQHHQGEPVAIWAGEALQRLPTDPDALPKRNAVPMPEWTAAYDTHAERGMTYGMRLYEHRLPLFAFKEMIKLLSGVYGSHGLRAEARFRAGVAAAAFGNSTAAARQWSLCRAHDPDSQWSKRAAQKLAALPAEALRRAGKPDQIAAAPKGSPATRLRIAEEFRKAHVLEDDQVIMEYLKVLTAARPKPGEGKKIVATAMLGLADSLAKTGRLAAAREQYTAVAAEFAETPWATRARSAQKGMEAGAGPKPQPRRPPTADR